MPKVSIRRAPPDGPHPVAIPLAEGTLAPPGLAAAAQAARFTGRAGQALLLHAPLPTLLVGAGPGDLPADWMRAGGTAVAHIPEGTAHLVLDARGRRAAEAAAMAAGACLRAWRFTRHRTRGVTPGLAQVTLLADDTRGAAEAWARESAAVQGCLLARDLVSEPANHLSTRHFAARLEALAAHGIAVDIWGRRRLERAGMGGLLAVGRAAASPPRLAILRWRGLFDAPPVVLVGKGVVFDTGGISIKGAKGMHAMRADMAGAAACAGAMLALALRRSPAPVTAVLPLAENATGADSYRPGDVLTLFGGRTVEILDTDAEGRLILADALGFAAETYRPRAMIDLATLTGAIVTALGHHRAGLFGNDAALMAAAAAAGEDVAEPLWPMPIGERHREDLRSDIADIRQCAPAGRGIPDACHAAAFLSAFAGDAPWAHLDIAGVEDRRAPDALGPKGASGFGVRLLDRLIADRFEEPDHHADAPRPSA